MSRACCGPIFKRNGGGRGLASVTTESAVRQTAKQHTGTSPIWLRAAATVLVFAVFYVMVFAVTAREYYKIVNE